MEMCCFVKLNFCDKTLPFSTTDFRLKIPRGLSLRLTRIPVHGRVKKPRIYILSVDRMFETLLQVMSNDGLKLLYVQLHRHLSTQFNNTGGEANLKKCMLLCLIQTSVLLLSSRRVKVTILKDSVLIDIWKEVDVEDYGSIITEQVAELYDFRKKIGISILFNKTFSFISSYKIFWKSHI